MDGVERFTLRLLGGFELAVDGGPLEVPDATRKVIAHVALQPRATARAVVAAQLWPDKSEQRAAANLRSALWRLRGGDVSSVIDASAGELALRPSVAMDVRVLRRAAAWVLRPADDRVVPPGRDDVRRPGSGHGHGSGNGNGRSVGNGAAGSSDPAAVDGDAVPRSLLDDPAGLDDDLLFEPLLPGWSDPWAVVERERLSQLQLHLLDVLIADLLDAHQSARAIDLALRLVALDPLRERSQCGLIAAYAAEGSLGHAQRQFARYCELVEGTTGRPPRIAFEEAAAGPPGCTGGPVRIARSAQVHRAAGRAELSGRRQPT